MSNLTVARERVQAHLTEIFESVSVDSDGDYSVSKGSSRVFVRVSEFGEKHSLVTVFSPVIIDAQLSPGLYEEICRMNLNYIFGYLFVEPSSETTGNVLMRHRLLGTFLDEEELGYAVMGILHTADKIDDELAAKYGGRVFHAPQ